MLKQARRGVWIGLVLLCGPLMDSAAAECLVDGSAPQGLFKIHLSIGCTKTERESRAIDAAAVLAALRKGQAVDLDGVVIRGTLALDTLPISSNPRLIDGIIGREDKEVRMVAGGLSIVNSVVQGTLVHRSPEGTLVFIGPVTFAGTTFEQIVDLSRSVFTQPVT